ncbi:hypothetical protein ACJW30_06G231400 [Castanea mollissima]
MASSSSGSKPSLSRRVIQEPTPMVDLQNNDEEVIDSELVPSSLAPIIPVLGVANEIQPLNPRVAYLCRFHAFEKAHYMDQNSTGRGVRQFKTHLLHRLEMEEEETMCILANNDPKEIQLFYQKFYEDNIRDGELKKKHEEMAKILQIASVLYEVLKTVVPARKTDEKTERYAKDVEKKKEQCEHYNILPLYAVGVKPTIMEFPEIKAALNALRNVDNLPMPRIRMTHGGPDDGPVMSTERVKSINDILGWLSSIFGFQKGNVANQREHLILLLANMHIWKKERDLTGLDSATVQKLKIKILKNYTSWCNYLCVEKKNKTPRGCDTKQVDLIYIGLYLLIWGEASNVRLMPECLCFIFHNMAHEVHGVLFSNLHPVSGETYQEAARDEESFLRDVITPIYQVLLKEVKRNKGGKASHSGWRNYDDLNEYFWSDRCLKLGWPMNPKADFFIHSDAMQPANERVNQAVAGKRKPKTNFVEVRTFLHLYRSFNRMWIFFILAFQAMLVVAWSPSGSLAAFFDADVFRIVLSIFITSAVLNFFQASLDIILSWNAWKSLKFSQILQYLLKFAVAAAWVVILPIGYSSSVVNPTGLVKFFSRWAGDWRNHSFYEYAVALYLIPNILSAILFFLPPLRRHMECSNWRIITVFMWWAQPKLYIGRGMHEDVFSLLKYTLFWIMLLISKLAFSYYVEILPLIGPTKLILETPIDSHQWHELFPYGTHNIGIVIAIWAPIVLVYFMDVQIWFAIFSTVFGAIYGAFSHLGEIRTLGMLRSRFKAVPLAFNGCLLPLSNKDTKRKDSDKSLQQKHIASFSQLWNEFILSMRMEDLISNRERDFLIVPYTSSDLPVVQWPPFLLASKIPMAIDMAKDFKGKDDNGLFKKIRSDDYMHSAVIECYQTLRGIIFALLEDEVDKMILRNICNEVERSIKEKRFLIHFRMNELPLLSEKLTKFLMLSLVGSENVPERQIINALQDVVEIIMQDIMVDGQKILESAYRGVQVKTEQGFEKLDFYLMQNKSWRQKVARIHLILNVRESAINVPQNFEACRRITFFVNSLLMNMPCAPKVREMLSFSVLTPYYKEDVLYSEADIKNENEDGISTLFYLQKIYPDEWTNFQERMRDPVKDSKYGDQEKEKMDLIRHWVSYRGQTLARTVRGMMYYRQALELQCFLEFADDEAILGGYRNFELHEDHKAFQDRAQALADLKFTYVVSCLVYGNQKKSSDPRDRNCYINILNLMLKYPSLRVAYIDEREEIINRKSQKIYYSVLVKGGEKLDEEIYRIKLPGNPVCIGEGMPEGQNHAIMFTRGEALQTIDMNQFFIPCTVCVQSRDRFCNYWETNFGKSSSLTVLIVYVFLYGRMYMVLSGMEKEILKNPSIQQSKALEEALATQSIFQFGLLIMLPIVIEIDLEKGLRTAVSDFIIMQLQLASVFFTFQLGTKAHYYGRTILHGVSKYQAVGRGFVVFHAKFADNYRLYSRSHFVKGFELFILLIAYEAYGQPYHNSYLDRFISFSMWFLVASWLFAPFVFNPSGFDRQKTGDDWTDWKMWMGNPGGIGILPSKSWELWWEEEHEHLTYASIRGRVLEIILAFRFFVYQYVIIYHLHIVDHSNSLLLYGLSWFVMVIALLNLKMVPMARRRLGICSNFLVWFRILKALLFLGFMSVVTSLLVLHLLTISDLFAAILAFTPTGWGLILVGQACRPLLKRVGFWDTLVELARAYDYVMGLIVFMPVTILSWLPIVSKFQTRMLFSQAFSRGLQISTILAGMKEKTT